MTDIQSKKDPGDGLNPIRSQEKTKYKYQQGWKLHQEPGHAVGNVGAPVLTAVSPVGGRNEQQQKKYKEAQDGPYPEKMEKSISLHIMN
jgi:hypothetical protein